MNHWTARYGLQRRWAAALLALAGIAGLPRAGAAQEGLEIKTNAVELRVTGRVHVQWDYTSVGTNTAGDAIPSNQFFIRRARASVQLKINDFVEGRVQPEYALGLFQLKDAYMDLVFSDAFRVRMGQFKRGFDFFELESSTQSLVIERTGFVRGVDSCKGVGAVCSYSRFTEKLEFSDRDIGLSVGGLVASHWVWSASVTNGEGQDALDDNDSKSFAARLEYRNSGSGLRVGANVGGHDFVNDSTSKDDDYGFAVGGDVNWGSYDGGLHVQAGVTAGDNWRNLDSQGDASRFFTTQGIVSYFFQVRDERLLFGLEPVARVSWADPDTDASDDEGLLFTPGFIIHFVGRNRFAVNGDIYTQDSRTEWTLRTQMYFFF